MDLDNASPDKLVRTPTLTSAAIVGLDGVPIIIEADSANALPGFSVVGLPDTAVQEARERVRAAIKNSGYPFPRKKVVINLAPADVRKAGTGYDLPIALAILLTEPALALHVAEHHVLEGVLCIGELGLGGDIRPVHGMLAIARCAKRHGTTTLILPRENVREAQLIEGLTLLPASSLRAVIEHLHGTTPLTPEPPATYAPPPHVVPHDIQSVAGHEHAKRALMIAAAGNHNLAMSGPPGSGKTMLAHALPSILPPLDHDAMIEVTHLWSVAGLLAPDRPIIYHPPFRNPHHSASLVALIGGGTHPRPGEVSLAHRGVLFLDEFPEFPRAVLESLRQPLEHGTVTIARARDHLTFPARFLLVVAQNPCPCGYLNDPIHPCTCAPAALTRYRNKLSGPILDRIDLVLDIPRLSIQELEAPERGEPAEMIRARVCAARVRQAERFTACPWATNADMPSEYIRKHLAMTDAARSVFRNAADKYHMSGRTYFRVLKVAQTIADLEKSDAIDASHIAEALHYRFRN